MVGLCDNVANVGMLASRPVAGGEQIVVLSRLRFAAGVCVLAAGLLMGGAGGAVAVADPDFSGSAAQGDDGTTAPVQQHSTGAEKPKKPKKAPVTTDDTNDSGLTTSTLGSGREQASRLPTGKSRRLSPRTIPTTRASQRARLARAGNQASRLHRGKAEERAWRHHIGPALPPREPAPPPREPAPPHREPAPPPREPAPPPREPAPPPREPAPPPREPAPPPRNRRHHRGNRRHHRGNRRHHLGNRRHHRGNRRHHLGNRRHHRGNRRHHLGNRRHHIGNRRHLGNRRLGNRRHGAPAPPRSELARRLLMWSPRFLVWRRRLRMWWRRVPTRASF